MWELFSLIYSPLAPEFLARTAHIDLSLFENRKMLLHVLSDDLFWACFRLKIP